MSPGNRVTPGRSTPAASGSIASSAPTSMPLSSDSGAGSTGISSGPISMIGSASEAALLAAPGS